ncbi:hypothetical protein ACWEOH_09220 [Agromyces sp. NPDC004153]
MNRSSIAAGVAAASALFLVLTATPASAARPVIDHWSEHSEHIEQVEHTDPPWCPDVPFDVLYVEDASGTFRFGQHGDGNYYGASSIRSTGSWTNVENGMSFSFVRHGSDKDVHVTDNGDGTITIDVAGMGVTKYYDDSGDLLFVDSGRGSGQLTLDINGTPENPDDDVFVDFIPGDQHGRTDTMNRDFCADILEFIG